MKIWWASFGLLAAAGLAVAVTGRSVANGTMDGAGIAWLAAGLALAAVVTAIVSLRRTRPPGSAPVD